MAIYQVSILPEGRMHIARLNDGNTHGAIQDGIQTVANHYEDHMMRGGYVGLAPYGNAIAVQLHRADGEIESWRLIVLYREGRKKGE